MTTQESKVAVLPTTSALARLDPQALLARAVEHNASIDVLERLVALAKDVRAIQAREAYNGAMALFQREVPRILKTSEAEIATRGGGGFSYRYAELAEILAAVQPVLGRHGLSVSWWNAAAPAGHVGVVCRIAHEAGHYEESGTVVMPISAGEDGRGANPMQRVGIAKTYARRYALQDILGIAPEDDPDGTVDRPSRSRRPAPAPPRAQAEHFEGEKGELVRELEGVLTERRVSEDPVTRANWFKRAFGEADLTRVDVAQLADLKAKGWRT